MTVDELIAEAAKLGGWVCPTPCSTIRRGECGAIECPITAVANARGRAYCQAEWKRAAEQLGLDRKSARRIVRAADYHHYQPRLRAKMLAAFGLAKE